MKKVISYTACVAGVLLWTFGFCAAFKTTAGASPQMHNDIFAILLNVGFFAAGTLLLYIAVKINPEPFCEALNDEEYTFISNKDDYCEKHNYSVDFEQLYKQIVLEKADRLIGDKGDEKM